MLKRSLDIHVFRIICKKRSLVIKKSLGSLKGPEGEMLYVFASQGRHSLATQGGHSRSPLKVATVCERSLDIQFFVLYVRNGHPL